MGILIYILGLTILAGNVHCMDYVQIKPASAVPEEQAHARESFQHGDAFFKGLGCKVNYKKASSFFESAAAQDSDLDVKLRAVMRLALICALEKNNERMRIYIDRVLDLLQQSKGMSKEDIKVWAVFLWLICHPVIDIAVVGKYYVCAAAWLGCGPAVELMIDIGINSCEEISSRDIPEPFEQIASDLQYHTSFCGKRVTPLRLAAVKGHKEIVMLLLDRGSIINEKDDQGVTTLHLSALGGHDAIVEILLAAGAEVDAADIFFCTPLHFAFGHNHKKVIKTLIEKGANLNAEQEDGSTPLNYPMEKQLSIELEEIFSSGVGIKQPWSSLLIAAFRGDKKKVELLLERGVDVNEITDGLTPLFGAIQNGHTEIVLLLLNKGADVNSKWLYGLTPLGLAVEGGYRELVIILVKRGAQVRSNNEEGPTPLQCAMGIPCYMIIVKYLIDCGFEPHEVHKHIGMDVLQLAAMKGFSEIVRVLVSNGSDVNAADGENSTPLHKAAQFGRNDGVRALMERGANILTEDSHGKTPLHKANYYRRGETCAVLLSHALILPAFSPHVIFESVCQKVNSENLELLTPLISPADYIRKVLYYFGHLGIPKDLHLSILSKNPEFVGIMASAVLGRLKNGIARGRLVEYMNRTPPFLKPILIERLYTATVDGLKKLMYTVASGKNYYADREMAAVFDTERFEGQFGQNLRWNLQSTLGFTYENL